MKFVIPALQVSAEDKEYQLLQARTITRVRLVEQSDEVQAAGEVAVPIVVVNGLIPAESMISSEEPLNMTLVTDRPPSSTYAIPIYVVQEPAPQAPDNEWKEYGISL